MCYFVIHPAYELLSSSLSRGYRALKRLTNCLVGRLPVRRTFKRPIARDPARSLGCLAGNWRRVDGSGASCSLVCRPSVGTGEESNEQGEE